jgi:hypothetical protein
MTPAVWIIVSHLTVAVADMPFVFNGLGDHRAFRTAAACDAAIGGAPVLLEEIKLTCERFAVQGSRR